MTIQDIALEGALATVRAGGELPPPSEWRLKVRCTVCGHLQYPYAINAEFEDTEDGVVMTKCFAGSSADFCDECESKGEPAMNMEAIGFMPAEEAPTE